MALRKLLELAAKAAGMPTHIDGVGFVMAHHPSWNPRDDDGDALRLAAKLKMDIEFGDDEVAAISYDGTGKGGQNIVAHYYEIISEHGNDQCRALRYAIFRNAVHIGRNIK
jgi:hypothetical protein